ncbi:dienelactone hydrolase family protein [Actinokineospora sp. PR83]|uniref:alpha/beta hydrolase family protein n=1 Tax=Actinokineospora sp. PR83 TaxID=2884908 RepID=UPI0027DEC675|nr:dienelactone hydrolase family protein [Actinokineospora sp. PR83]MCG8914281.1 dienelactone hydrolase family protein [Actinokineospora sp. PR83]
MRRNIVKRSAVLAAAAAVGAAAFLGPQAFAGQLDTTTAAALQVSAFAKGPNPTDQSIRAQKGPFAVQQQAVAAQSGRAFNRGTIYYPTDTSQGTYGAVAVIPGFLEPEFTTSWYGPTLASHGFVVITLEPISITDFPEPRSNQLLAAVDWLATESPVKDRVDPNRLAVMGHSMGGGGTLLAASKNPALKAAIPLAPWNMSSDFSDVTVPTLIIGADNDVIAPTFMHADPFYESLKGNQNQGYLKLKGADHFTTNGYTATVTKFAVSWLKRFVDDDTRYSQFLCPAPTPDASFVSFKIGCPV